MIPGSFDYVAATSLPEAVTLLERYGDEAKILAGGHSLIPLLRFRLASPSILIDIKRTAYYTSARSHAKPNWITPH
jgi:carbon-monoxide dehydrogenase medium subunit